MSNILYILGNGFDMAMGMKTSYPDFYDYLSKLEDKDCSRLLKLMKHDVNMRKELWADMELALGKFTDRVNVIGELTDFYYELCDHLNDYLEEQDNDFKAIVSQQPEIKDKFIQDISNFDVFFTDRDKQKYRRYIDGDHEINIMSFNYTNVLETLLSSNGALSFPLRMNTSYLKSLYHVHGVLGDTIIIGVDKKEQIDNVLIRNDVQFQNLLIKAQANEVTGTLRAEFCEYLINNADAIILYGVSLGETDEHWWKLIGENFKKRNLMLINHFYLPGVNAKRRRQLIANYEDSKKPEFMRKLGYSLKMDWPKDTDERLIFVTNSNAFSMSKYLGES